MNIKISLRQGIPTNAASANQLKRVGPTEAPTSARKETEKANRRDQEKTRIGKAKETGHPNYRSLEYSRTIAGATAHAMPGFRICPEAVFVTNGIIDRSNILSHAGNSGPHMSSLHKHVMQAGGWERCVPAEIPIECVILVKLN